MTDNIKDAINTYDYDEIASGMLSSPHIAYCIRKYKIVENSDMSCLGPATYHMRIGGKVMTWKNGEKVEYILGDKEDRNKNIRTKIELDPNSLTFVTTIEKFNLPKDIIARFNLKSKWVHEGLLLGTGPIVDPELVANLLIPLHNFSSQVVTINYNDKLISVEFTKTLNPDDNFTFSGNSFSYKKNKSRIFNFEEYRKRIGGKKVESSVSNKFEEFNKSFITYERRLTQFSIGGVVAIIAVFVGIVALVFTSWQLITGAREQLKEAENIVKVTKNNNIDYGIFAKKNDYAALSNSIDNLKLEIENIKINMRSRPLTSADRMEIEKKLSEMELATEKLKE